MSEKKVMVEYQKVFKVFSRLFLMVEDLTEYQDSDGQRETLDILEEVAKQWDEIAKEAKEV